MADRAYDIDRLKNLIHLVIWEAGARANFGATKLYKVAWFSDARQYVLSGQSITGAQYIREKHGPIPMDAMVVLNRLAREGAIERWRGPGNEWHFRAVTHPDPNMFSAEELKQIRYWTNHIDKDHTAKSISDFSHDYGWEIAKMREPLPFFSVLAERMREPTDEEIERAKARAAEIGLI